MIGGVVISGTRSGVGKTTISTAIMGVIEDIAPFKVGPDYIDPRFHEFITGKNSYNLDIYMCGAENVRRLFNKKTKDSFGVVEGVMGLYDGLGHELDNGSTAHLSRELGLPVILVVDAKGGSTSVAAQVLGYKMLDERVEIGGVILNNVSSEKLYNLLSEGIQRYTGVECVGYFPKNSEIELGSRHLGLRQAEELEELEVTLEKLRNMARKYIDIDRIIEIGRGAKNNEELIEKIVKNDLEGLNIAVARDRAFSFYYRHNLEYLVARGAKVNYFSPLKDEVVPIDTDIIYIGGGYPENYLEELTKNKKTMNSIVKAHKDNIPIYAECGGYMYLARSIKTLDDERYEMCGVLDGNIQMKNRLNIRRFGYVELKTPNETLGRAHEFHYSDVEIDSDVEFFFGVSKKDRGWSCGEIKKNTIGGYPHLHFLGNEELFNEIFIKRRR